MMEPTITEQILNTLGFLAIAAGGGAAATVAVIKFFGENWVKHKFAKDLAEVKAEISLLSSRRMKLHDKEYEVFPELWAKLMKARDSLTASIYSFHQMPDFSSMTEEKTKKWLDRSDLDEEMKEYFLECTDKTKGLSRIQDAKRLDQANKHFFEFNKYLQANSIFLSPEIKIKFEKIANKIRSSWAAKKVDFDMSGNTGSNNLMMKAIKIDKDEVGPLVHEIETLVQKKIFPNERTTNKGLEK